MASRSVTRALQVGILGSVFATGFLCGSLVQRPADAQVGELGDALKKQAGQAGGPLGAATELGTTIVDMQEHVSGLQKNLDALNKIKAALGG